MLPISLSGLSALDRTFNTILMEGMRVDTPVLFLVLKETFTARDQAAVVFPQVVLISLRKFTYISHFLRAFKGDQKLDFAKSLFYSFEMIL